ncbi:hypothetical protein SUGI_0006860 [Cryptomeria japonica]|nr:hypothetical protein SUGI_0006860 [Cryptomeria japonica]
MAVVDSMGVPLFILQVANIIYEYLIEIQALFFMEFRCAGKMLKPENRGKEFMERIAKRGHGLSYHLRTYFWLDLNQLNNIYHCKMKEYSHTAVNKFNVIPNSIPERVFDFMTMKVGYFIGNVSPARMDFQLEEKILTQIKVERSLDVDAYFDLLESS